MIQVLGLGIIYFCLVLSMSFLSQDKINFKKKDFYICYILTLFLIVLNYHYSMPSIRVILNVFIYILMALIFFKKSIQESVILGTLAFLLSIISEMIYATLVISIFDYQIVVETDDLVNLINNIFVGIILIGTSCLKSFQKIYSEAVNITFKIDKKKIIVFCLLIVVIFNFACWIGYFVYADLVSKYYLTLLGSMMCLFSSLLIFYYFKINNRYTSISEKYSISLETIREFEKALASYRMHSHENKNQLKTIHGMSKNKKINAYIDSLLDEKMDDDEKLMEEVEKIPMGGLRGIIYTKALEIKSKEIPFELAIDRKITKDMIERIDYDTLTDICKILGVFLDNAIEAVSNLKEKYILIELYEVDEELIIGITNNYIGFLNIENMNEDGISTKGKGRGYGLSLVKKLVKNNNKLSRESEIIEDSFKQILKIKV